MLHYSSQTYISPSTTIKMQGLPVCTLLCEHLCLSQHQRKMSHSLDLNTKTLSLCRKQQSCLIISLYTYTTGKEEKFSSWVLTFAKWGSLVEPKRSCCFFETAVCVSGRMSELWELVLHFIWNSVGWFPLCLWLKKNSFFWKMVLFWQ